MNPKKNLQEALRQFQKGAYQRALEHYLSAEQSLTENIDLQINIIACYQHLGQYERARPKLKALVEKTQSRELCRQFIQCDIHLNTLPESIAYFKSSNLNLKEYALCLIFSFLGDSDQFDAHYQQAITIWPNDPEILRMKAQLHKEQGQLEDALHCINHALKYAPNDPLLHIEAGEISYYQEHPKKALSLFEKAYALAPHNSLVFNKVLSHFYRFSINPHVLFKFIQQGNEHRLLSNLEALTLSTVDPVHCAYPKEIKSIIHQVKSQPKELLTLITSNMLPPVAQENDQEERIATLLDALSAHQQHIDLNQSLTSYHWLPRPSFYLDYYNVPEEQLYALRKQFAALYQLPPINDISRENQRPNIAIYCDRGFGLFHKLMGHLLHHWNDTHYTLTIISFPENQPLFQHTVKNPHVQFMSIQANENLFSLSQRIAKEQFALIYYFEVNTSALNYFLPMMRLAPVQCTGAAMCTTSGLSSIDFFIMPGHGNALKESQSVYTEQLISLPKAHLFMEPPHSIHTALTKEALGFEKDQHLYLFHHQHFKIHPDMDCILLKICQEDEKAVILLSEGNAGYESFKEVLQKRLKKTLGVYDKHLMFMPYLNREQLFAITHVADVMLDTFYFSAGITALETLIGGTPIISLPDHSKSQLTHCTQNLYQEMNAPELITYCIASSPEDYAEKALSLTHNPQQLSELKKCIQEKRHRIFSQQEGWESMQTTLTTLAEHR